MRGGGLSICLALLRIATGVSLIGPGLKKLSWFAHPGLEQQLAGFASHAPNGMVTSYLHAVTPHHAVLARIVVLGELGLGALLILGLFTPVAATLPFLMVAQFHSAIGAALPLLMTIAEFLHLRTGDTVYLELARRWAKGTSILFAVGAVSGTVLSFELGLLWPRFMEFAGSVIGMPFSLEGFAFFTEAIFLGVYLYGRDRISSRSHLWAGVAVAVSGTASVVFVVLANAWMNAPTGFEIIDGKIADIDPIAAMLNPAAFHEVVHMTLAAFVATGFVVAAIHAFFLLRDRSNPFHRAALGLALAVACISMPLQILSGDISARAVARLQPAKLAAMEAHYRTKAGAPLVIGGIPQDATMPTEYALE